MILLAPLMLLAAPAIAPAPVQTTTKTEVSHDTDQHDGVVTHSRKVTHVTKTRTRRPKKILGVKVGRKTVTHKTVQKTTVSSNGDHSTTVSTK
ncbi:hypothetical protein [Sphingomonas bacterium]|uniref:hypothetical protein n=1 Tax=Sphingomonas bacterium TaxID=1895847 RepID=UPI001577250C|nr:hypothetical protein [Sphingomonas bacterium]